MKQTRNEIVIKGKVTNQDYSDILFEGLIIRNAKVTKTRFYNTHFKNSQLGSHSRYIDCQFIKCKFYGQYSTLGYSSRYINCNFIDCEFIGTSLFLGTTFKHCEFSGKLKNAIITDKPKRLFKKLIVFNQCDLSEIIFNNISLYGKNSIYDCVLPINGIRKYKNDNDKLINRALEICSNIKSKDKIESEVIFNRELKSGQNPIILDELFLTSFFKSSNSRKIFDEIVNEFEIKNCS